MSSGSLWGADRDMKDWRLRFVSDCSGSVRSRLTTLTDDRSSRYWLLGVADWWRQFSRAVSVGVCLRCICLWRGYSCRVMAAGLSQWVTHNHLELGQLAQSLNQEIITLQTTLSPVSLYFQLANILITSTTFWQQGQSLQSHMLKRRITFSTVSASYSNIMLIISTNIF